MYPRSSQVEVSIMSKCRHSHCPSSYLDKVVFRHINHRHKLKFRSVSDRKFKRSQVFQVRSSESNTRLRSLLLSPHISCQEASNPAVDSRHLTSWSRSHGHPALACPLSSIILIGALVHALIQSWGLYLCLIEDEPWKLLYHYQSYAVRWAQQKLENQRAAQLIFSSNPIYRSDYFQGLLDKKSTQRLQANIQKIESAFCSGRYPSLTISFSALRSHNPTPNTSP